MHDFKEIFILGSTGFIGKHLLEKIINETDYNINLILNKSKPQVEHPRISVFYADIFSQESLENVFTENSVVINLIYLNEGITNNKNIEASLNILRACQVKGVRKLIHCSTAVVSGRQSNNLIYEETEAIPFSKYEKDKLNIEMNLLNLNSNSTLELVIIRPTAVFGAGGKNLLTTIHSLAKGNRIINYLKSSLYNNRTMNLVPVCNVVSAIVFLINFNGQINNESFIISSDDDELNNFRSIEKIIINRLGVSDYKIPRLIVFSFFLTFVLYFLNKSNINPNRKFISSKLKKLGWSPNKDFKLNVEGFVDWTMKNQ